MLKAVKIRTRNQEAHRAVRVSILTIVTILVMIVTTGIVMAQPQVPKVCSVTSQGGVNFRDTISVPQDWSFQACSAFATLVGAGTFQLGCAEDTGIVLGSPGGGKPQGNSCNWGHSNPHSTQQRMLCSVVSSDNWRDTIRVNQKWDADACESFMTWQSAGSYQLGCAFGTGKTVFGTSGNSSTAAENPDPNCGWGVASQDRPTRKLCSVVAPSSFRDTVTVPDAWTASECVSWEQAVAASSFQIGCDSGTSGTSNFGGNGGSLPNPNCGW
jgi:hypothetical protein